MSRKFQRTNCVSVSLVLFGLAASLLLSGTNSLADTLRSECGFSNSAEVPPESTSACTFSQRQGYISIRIDGGKTFDFSPTGDLPGNYKNQQGEPVYRKSGLGDAGQLFQLPSTYLYVFWYPDLLDCDATELTAPGHCKLRYGDVGFNVSATTGSSINQLTIYPWGLTPKQAQLSAELDGTAYRAEVADLDANGLPELYVYVASAGSGSYGSLVAYAVGSDRLLSRILIMPLAKIPDALEGYMGHDEFSVVENSLVRRFPIYTENDTNAAASGGTRQIQYKLIQAESGWRLELDRLVDY